MNTYIAPPGLSAPEAMRRLRKELMSGIVSNTFRMSIRRVMKFMALHNFQITPWICVHPADRTYFMQRCHNTGLVHSVIFDQKFNGICLPVLQFSIVFRGTLSEKKFGPKYAESILVHELVHGAGNLLSHLESDSDGTIFQYNFGLLRAGKGRYFEEELASYYEILYNETFLGFSYTGHTPGSGLKLLLMRCPQLLSVIRQAHLGGPLEPLEILIDSIGGSGLFQALYNLERSDQLHTLGLKIIQSALAEK